MKRESNSLNNPCTILVLKSLAIKPMTPAQIKAVTKIPWNYVNVIMRKLESIGIIKCLTPGKSNGKVFCINPENKGSATTILEALGYDPKVRHLPKLNWKAYGKLVCRTSCPVKRKNQLRIVFDKAVRLGSLGIGITQQNIESELRKENTIIEIHRSDIYRALRKLKDLGVLIPSEQSRHLEYNLTEDAVILKEYLYS